MKNKLQQGFTYVEVMIAIVLLLVGILSLLSAISGAIFQAKGQEEQLDAKQIATSAMESIMSVKETDTENLGWNSVGNVNKNIVNGVPKGIFLNGFQPVRTGAGPDQIIGTADDNGDLVLGFQREIVINDECDESRPSPNCSTPGDFDVKIRSVSITVKYTVGAVQRQEKIRTILTDYYIAK